jgi:hypothetical protein
VNLGGAISTAGRQARRGIGFALRPLRRMITSRAPMDAYALVHMTSSAGDALMAIALAGSIFFTIPIGQARVRVALYLALTMAPLAVAAPILVPLLDRAGPRRVISAAAGGGRAACALYAAAHFDSLALFPAVFIALVLSRVHAVTRNGLVAAYAGDPQSLIPANAKLGRVGAIAISVVAIPGAIALKWGGAPLVLIVAAVVYATSCLLNVRLPRPSPPRAAPEDAQPAAAVSSRGRIASLTTPAAATACLRGAQGFLMLLLAFSLREAGKPAYWLGAMLLAGVIGGFVGDLTGPKLRPGTQEEGVVVGALVLAGASAAFALTEYSLATLCLFTFLAGAATEIGRLAFQSLMQREAPGGVTGRVFVRYEVLFQLAWVAGAFIPAMFPIPFRLGVTMLAVFYLAMGATFLVRSEIRARRREAAERE